MMNWIQDPCMMLSSQAPPQGGVSAPAGPHQPAMHRLPPTGSALPPTSPQIAYEGRVSLLSNPGGSGQSWGAHPPHFNHQFNFNLLHHEFNKQKEHLPFPLDSHHGDLQDRETSPSSAGSPRTDDTPSSDKLDRSQESLEKSFDHKSEQAETNVEDEDDEDRRSDSDKTSLEILQEHIRQIPKPGQSSPHSSSPEPHADISSPVGGDSPPAPSLLSVRRDIQVSAGGEDLRNISEEKVEEEFYEEEELRIDEEMLEDRGDGPEEQFEALDRSVDKLAGFVGFQPYLHAKGDNEDGLNSLEKLQQVLNNRMFNPVREKVEAEQNGNSSHVDENGEYRFILPADEEGTVFQCHICSFTATTRVQFNAHVNTHYDFQCLKCEFEHKSESCYVRHLKEEHNCTPEDLEEAEVRVPRVNSQGKVKTFKCKQCEFVAVTKIEFWKHGRGHIKPEKLLFCPKCIFVTEYKHHLEYHLRNHYGTKPFKCTHCNYSCVNKSMLNSHMKSHTNVYQYRCADCTYATKYCHSLKLHLRKYGHKPAMVLNNDGSPNSLPPLDMFGGMPKRPKGRKEDMFPPTMLPQFPNLPPNFMQMQLQHLQNQFGHHPKVMPVPPFRMDDPSKFAHKLGEASNGNMSPTFMGQQSNEEQIRCDKCEFSTVSKEVFRNHMMLHASTERGALHQLLSSPLQHSVKRPLPDLNKSGEDLTYSPRMQSMSPPSSPFGARSAVKSESPNSVSSFHPHMNYFNKLAMSNPLLQGLVPHPALRALMEERHNESLNRTPDSQRDTPDSTHSREGAPLPPNKRHKADIFASLYASRMSEAASEKAESPNGALDLSKETVIGGGSHGSSSDVDTGSNPRSHSSSPALSSSNSKSRRKGKAFKISRVTDSEEECVGAMPSLVPISGNGVPEAKSFLEASACKFCGISFHNIEMYRSHMEYHGFEDPFKCSQCGEQTNDALAFFMHIARREHV